MAADNKLELIIDIDNSPGKRSVDEMNAKLNVFEREAVAGAKRSSVGMNQFELSAKQARDQMHQASRAAELLASRIGISLPEGARKWLVSLRGMAPLLASAFSASAVIAIGMALFDAGKRLYEWIDGSKEAAEAAKKQREKQDALNRSMSEYVDALKKIRNENEKIGLSGSARTGRDIVQLGGELQGLYELRTAVQQQIANFPAANATWGRSQEEVAKLALLKKSLSDLDRAITPLEMQMQGLQITLGFDRAEEGAKRIDAEIKRVEALTDAIRKKGELETSIEKDLAALRASARAAYEKSSGFVSSVAPPSFADQVAGGLRMNQESAMATIKQYQDQRTAVEQLTQANEDLSLSILKRYGTSQEVLQFELEALEKQKALYSDNAEAIAVIEERKKLLIKQNNLEIAEDSRNQFERTAQSIEGFFNRVFMSAKSFGDIWKQLWTQIVNYLVSQFARMAASWLASRGQMEGGLSGTGGGSGGSGFWDIIKSVPDYIGKIWGSRGGSGNSGQSTGYDLNQLEGWGGSGGSGQSTGYDLNQLEGWGGSGSSTASASSSAGSVGGYASNAGAAFQAGGPAGLIAYLGYLQTTKGFIPGIKADSNRWSWGGYFKADVIGPGAGVPLSHWLGKLYKSAEEKIRDKVRQTYGIEMNEPQYMKSIVDTANQTYGGDLDRAIQSQEVRELVQLYALSTGQTTKGMPAKMTAGSWMQSGGSLYSMSPGQPSALPGAALNRSGAGGSTVINISIPGAKQFFESETVRVVVDNPRAVQTSATKATRSNYNRRELTSLQLSPGTLTS